MRLLAFERRWLLAVFHLMLPRSAFFPIGAEDAPMAAFTTDLLQRAPLSFALGLRAALLAVVFYPVWAARTPRTLFSWPAGAQLDALEKMAQSRFYLIREMPMLLKMTACLGFFGLPQIQRAMGIENNDPLPAHFLPKDARE